MPTYSDGEYLNNTLQKVFKSCSNDIVIMLNQVKQMFISSSNHITMKLPVGQVFFGQKEEASMALASRKNMKYRVDYLT
jgi:hypothetical protein